MGPGSDNPEHFDDPNDEGGRSSLKSYELETSEISHVFDVFGSILERKAVIFDLQTLLRS